MRLESRDRLVHPHDLRCQCGGSHGFQCLSRTNGWTFLSNFNKKKTTWKKNPFFRPFNKFTFSSYGFWLLISIVLWCPMNLLHGRYAAAVAGFWAPQDVQYEKIAMDWVMEYQPERYNVLMRRPPLGGPGKCIWLRLDAMIAIGDRATISSWAPQNAFGCIWLHLASRERFLVMAAGYAQVEFYSLVYWEFRLPGWCPRLRKAGGRKCLWPATRPTWWLHRLVLSLDSWNWHIFHPMRDDDLAWSQLNFIVFWSFDGVGSATNPFKWGE